MAKNTYTVTAPNGKSLSITGDKPPTEQELDEIFTAANVQAISKVNTPVDNVPEERSWGDAAVSTGLRVVPAIAGGLLGSLGSPVGTALGGAAGGALGESLAEWYEGTDQNPTQIALSAALNAIPTAKYLAKGGTAVLRAIAPGVERRLAGMLAPKAASVGAGLLDRVNPRELAKTVAKSATTGAVTAPIENSASRYVQGQPTTRQDVTRDMTLGALLGGGTPVVGKIAQVPFRMMMAPTSGAGVVRRLRAPEYTDTEIAQQANAANRAAGRVEKPTAASSAASRGYTGSITQQQDRALADLVKANSRIDSMLSQPDLALIPLSDSTNLAGQLRSLAGYFKGSSDLEKMARTAEGFASEVEGKVAVKPQVVHEIKKFLDAARNESSFAKDPSQLSAQAALVDLSDSVRGDLKTALPQIAKLLDFETENYGILGGLYKSGAKGASGLSFADFATLTGVGGLTAYSPQLGGTLAAAGVARKVIANSPRARARLGNMINRLAGNEYDLIPGVENLPQQRPVALLGSRKLGIPEKSSAADPSGVVPGYAPFISRVIPRIDVGSAPAKKRRQTPGIRLGADQAPPRTGGVERPGRFGGILSEGELIGKNQVPFTGSVPLGGRPSRGEPRVQTMPPVLDPDVIVTPVPRRVSPPANVLEGEILESNAPVVPPVRVSNGETNVEKRERSTRKLRTAKPTVEKAPPANATVSKTAQATDTPAEAAKEIQSEVSRVIDVDGVTKAMEIKRRVLAALMEEMEPAKKSLKKWDTSGIDEKGRHVNVPSPYTETILLTIPGDGAFRIPRTPDAITAVMKRITGASSSAWQGVGNVKSPMPVSKPKIPTATW